MKASHSSAFRLAALLSLLAVIAATAPARTAQADPAASPIYPIGGRILGLDTICGDCKVEKVTSDCTDFLEGPVFDRAGTLWVIGVLKGVLWRVTSDGHCTVGVHLPPEIRFPAGLRFAPDGKLYGVAMGAGLFSVDLASSKAAIIAGGVMTGGYPDGDFHGLDDLFIDRAGGIYMTDAAGSSVLNPIGQLLYREANGNIKRVIAGGLMFPNGVVLSPDEKTLYIDEWAANRILAVPVIAPGVINPALGYVFATLNGGHGPDSMTADAAGNIYAAHYGSSEVVVFAPNGDYYGAIRLPEGAGSDATNVAFHDGYLYVTESAGHTVWRVKTMIPGIAAYGGQ